jgi:hypothetical protein
LVEAAASKPAGRGSIPRGPAQQDLEIFPYAEEAPVLFRFVLFGREIFAVDLQLPDLAGPAPEGEFDEPADPEERIRLGLNAELADDDPEFEDRFELPSYGFGPTGPPT